MNMMEGAYTVADGMTTSAHPTLFPHQVSELSQNEQIERLKTALFDCSKRMFSEPITLAGLFCNRTWDNVMCWPDTAAGTVGYQPCPAYINGFDQAEYATRHCQENGTWYHHPDSGRPWTNFSACIRKPGKGKISELIILHMPNIKLLYTIGYSMSLAALIMAVTIMIYFRRLHCQRNLIHLHMFFAFLFRAGFSLLKNILLVQDLGFPDDVNSAGEDMVFKEGTHWPCKLFFTLFMYILLTSLMWLFNEGLYLVLILSVSVFADKTKMWWFCALGWVLPLLFVIPWVTCRTLYDDMLCWNVHVRDEFYWIIRGPMFASVAVNFLFFINIVRTLFTKLTAVNCPESKKVRYRKLAKSTLILIPLFAVYYMGFIWLPDDISPTSEVFKMYVEMLFNSFQGFLVALLFCFLNQEVQNEIRKKWKRLGLRRSGSWRSQPSIGSFLRRSMHHRDHNGSHSLKHSQSDTTHSVTDRGHPRNHNGDAGDKINGHLSPISEETAPLNVSLSRDNSGSQVCSIEQRNRPEYYTDEGGDSNGRAAVTVLNDDVKECDDDVGVDDDHQSCRPCDVMVVHGVMCDAEVTRV
ncbi:hypothetical protein V1264_013488 [Littorina saxatilis]|uniref:Uncharacterized protein n=1 Tax=Littorina saxatilis TaxID=31220 RepID=A0AAN9BNU9_9CAEN